MIVVVKKKLLNILLEIKKFKKTAKNKYGNLPEEVKDAKREYGKDRYISMTKMKNKLKEY